MKPYKNILVAIDGSKEADYAFKKAVELAKSLEANLYLTHVIDINYFTYIHASSPRDADQLAESAHNLLRSYQEKAMDFGLFRPQKIVHYGSPKIHITQVIAKEVEADLIVCGATGLNRVERILIGSVSDSIVRHATCDVLVVRPTPEE